MCWGKDAKQRGLGDKIKEFEHKHKKPESTIAINNPHWEFNSLLSDKIEEHLRFTNQRYYEYDNRAIDFISI